MKALCCLLFFAALAYGRIITSTSWVSTIQTKDTFLQAATVTTTFDEENYVSLGCASSVFHSKTVELGPCTDGEGTQASPKCVKTGGTVYTFDEKVAEFWLTGSVNLDLIGLVLTVRNMRGNPTVTVYAGMVTHVLLKDNVVLPFTHCGAELIAAAGTGWTGSIKVKINTDRNSTLELLVPTGAELDCPFDLSPCVDPYCPQHIKSTNDSFFTHYYNYYVDQINRDDAFYINEEEVPNTLSTIFNIQVVQEPAKVATFGSGIGTNAIDNSGHLDGQCRIIYKNLRGGSPSAPVVILGQVVSPKEKDCSAEDFDSKVALWDEVILALDNASENKYTTAQTYSYVNLAHTIAASQDWSGCRELAAQFLARQRYGVVEFTDDCLTPPGSPEWATDPCCNTALLNTQCCAEAPYNVFKNEYTYQRDITTLSKQCIYPYCADTILRNYENVIGNSGSCSEESDKANNDPRFTDNPYDACFVKVFGKKCFFPSQCEEVKGAQCDTSNTACTIPCSDTQPCYRGTCQFNAQFGNICVLSADEESESFNTIFPFFTSCIFNEIDPYLAALLKAEVAPEADDATLNTQFQQRLTSGTCVDPITGLQPWLPPQPKTEADCLAAEQWCPWLQCKIPSECSLARCQNARPGPAFCGLDLGSYLQLPMGNPLVCEVNLLDTLIPDLTFVNKNPTLCQALLQAPAGSSHEFVGVPNTNFQAYSACIRPNVVTAADCYKVDWCIPNLIPGVACQSYCEIPRNSATSCNAFRVPLPGTTEFAQGIWSTWTSAVDGTTKSVCAVVGLPWPYCVNQNGAAAATGLLAAMGGVGTWRAGYRFVPAVFNSPATCGGICYDGANLFLTADTNTKAKCEAPFTCTSCILGTEPTCNNQTLCEQSFSCDNPTGCLVFPQYLTQLPYDVPCVYSPIGCIAPLPKPNCDLSNRYRGDANIKWQYRFSNQDACESNSFICRMAGTARNVTYEGTPDLPDGFSNRNKEECEACGGSYEPYFKWKPAKWVRRNSWLDLTWITKAGLKAQWTSQINKDAFLSLLEVSRGQRLANILVGELFCNYGTERELFKILSCNCGTETETCNSNVTTAELTLSGMSACEGVPGDISVRWITREPLVFTVGGNFTIDSGEICVKVALSTVPLYLLQEEEAVTLSSLFITSESSKKSTLGKQFIYNTQDPPVVVGQLIGDGVGFDFDVNGDVDDFSVCIEYPLGWDDWQLRMEPAWKTIVFANNDLTVFTISDVKLALTAKLFCVPLTSDTIVFPAIAIDEWDDLELQNSWPAEELGFDIALAVLYAILFVICFGSLFFNMYLTFIKKENTKTIADFLALVFLFILTILRTIYFSGVPAGEWESSFALVIIFGDLPALLFLGAVILTGNKWGQIYYTSRKLGTDDYEKKNKILAGVAFFLIATIFMIFIILSAIYGAEINNIEPTTCQDPQDVGITYVEAISLVYKCIFAFYCLLTAIFFGFFGGSFVKLVFDFTQKGEKEARTRKFLLVTTVCVLALLALSAILIASTRIFFDNMAKFAIILCTEWFPISGLCFLYGMQNFNRKAAKDATQATNRTKQSTRN